jgi:CDP-diacylglycerol pyrophosphatase
LVVVVVVVAAAVAVAVAPVVKGGPEEVRKAVNPRCGRRKDRRVPQSPDPPEIGVVSQR